MSTPVPVPTPAPTPEEAQIQALAATEGFCSFKFANYEGALIAEFVIEDRTPIAFSVIGLERRLTKLKREKKPHAFTAFVLGEMVKRKGLL